MSYPFTDYHERIRETANSFLQRWYDGGKGPERVYQSGIAYDPEAWTSFAQELGMTAIAITEDYDGAVLGELGRIVVMEELGASLCAIPFLTTGGIVVDLISRIGTDEAKQSYLPKIAAGEMKAAYCDGHDAKKKKVFNVIYADCADKIFMSRRIKDRLEIITISSQANDLIITPENTIDPTRRFCTVDWSGVLDNDITIIGTTTQAELNEIVIQSFIALAAECVGGAQKCLDITLEYAEQYVQLGQPIASLQAIEHRCADMSNLIEKARFAVYAAAMATPEDKTEAALIAKSSAIDTFVKVAGDAIHIHDGMASTWQSQLDFFFKRAIENQTMFGSPA